METRHYTFAQSMDPIIPLLPLLTTLTNSFKMKAMMGNSKKLRKTLKTFSISKITSEILYYMNVR